ncbi:MAG: hypothetical protein M3Q30_22135 [Actinomycetota bacterium]|nr:hypothetical protein [Actinomycetota bacterium]
MRSLPEPLPTVDWTGHPAGYEEVGDGFMLTSALREGSNEDAEAAAYALAAGATGGDSTGHTWKLKTPGGALGAEGSRLALILPVDMKPPPSPMDRKRKKAPTSSSVLNCLRRNNATAIAYIQDLATLVPTSALDPAHQVALFGKLAQGALNSFATRKELPNSGVYKSRAGTAWLEHRALTSPIP